MLTSSGIFVGKKRWLALVALLLVCLLLFTSFWHTKQTADAQVVHFYPQSCLGGWNNPQYAQGAPEVTQLGEHYNDKNSAVYTDNAAALYCGGYTGTLPPDTKHTEVTVLFSWSQRQDDTEIIYPTSLTPTSTTSLTASSSNSSTSSATTTSDNGTSENTTPESIDLAPVEEGTAVTLPATDSNETEPVIEVLPEEPEPEPEPEPNPEPEEAAPAEVSWWPSFISVAYATETEAVVESNTVEVLPPAEARFAVRYTLDGTTWLTLGHIADVRNDIRLQFPAGTLTSVDDITRVQLALVPLLQIETNPEPVYLDALWLEVSYAPTLALGVYDAVTHTPAEYDFSELTFAQAVSVGTSSTSSVPALATTSTTTVVATQQTFIDPATIKYLTGIDKRYVLLHQVLESGRYTLWLFDLLGQDAYIIADEAITIGSHRGGVKDRMIFWYSRDKTRLYVYDLRTAGTYHEILIAQNLTPQAEAFVYEFPFTQWQVVDAPEEFYFRSSATGEEFSDGNNTSLGVFLEQFSLKTILGEERLAELGIAGI